MLQQRLYRPPAAHVGINSRTGISALHWSSADILHLPAWGCRCAASQHCVGGLSYTSLATCRVSTVWILWSHIHPGVDVETRIGETVSSGAASLLQSLSQLYMLLGLCLRLIFNSHPSPSLCLDWECTCSVVSEPGFSPFKDMIFCFSEEDWSLLDPAQTGFYGEFIIGKTVKVSATQ